MMTFRACVAVFLLIAFCVQARQMTKAAFGRMFMETARKCAKENNVTGGINMSLLNQTETVERELKCFSNCLLDRFSLIDGNGNLKSQAMQSFLNNMPKSEIRESIQSNYRNCLREGSTDPCEKSHKIMKCLFRTSSERTSGRRRGGQESQIETKN